MAKFCTKCGKPLVDGMVCDCEKKESSKERVVEKLESQEEKVVTREKSNDLGNTIIDILKNCWKKPVDVMMSHQKKDTKFGLILIAINVVVFGILTYFLVNNTFNGIIGDINEGIRSAVPIGGQLVKDTELLQKVNLPFMNIFMAGAISLAAGYLILVSMARLFFGKVFKGKGKFGDYLVVAGLATPLSTVIMVAAVIASFLSYKLALIIFIASAVAFHVLFVHGNLEILKAKENKLIYSEALTISLTTILSIIVTVIVISILVASATYTASYPATPGLPMGVVVNR